MTEQAPWTGNQAQSHAIYPERACDTDSHTGMILVP